MPTPAAAPFESSPWLLAKEVELCQTAAVNACRTLDNARAAAVESGMGGQESFRVALEAARDACHAAEILAAALRSVVEFNYGENDGNRERMVGQLTIVDEYRARTVVHLERSRSHYDKARGRA